MPSRTSAADARPDIDDHLVASESRYEMWDGELVYVSPADSPHGTRHSQLASLLEAHVGAAFDVAVDMLTRTSETDDVAPDASVFPEAPDPRTGGRQLEQLAFEIVSTQALSDAGAKASKLVDRGVRRVFAIDLGRSQAFEWSSALGGWSALDPADHIVDPALEVPLPVASLLQTARTDDAVARALIARDNPVIVATRKRDRDEGRREGKAEGRREGKAEGRREGKAETLLVMLAARGLVVDDHARARILGEQDHDRLDRWIGRGVTCVEIGELFAED